MFAELAKWWKRSGNPALAVDPNTALGGSRTTGILVYTGKLSEMERQTHGICSNLGRRRFHHNRGRIDCRH